MLELRTLGTLSCRDAASGRELHSLVAQPKRVSLLVYLAVARPRGFHRRDTLLGLFWPDASETRARAALSQAIYTLRRMLGEDVIITRGDEDLATNPGAVKCDAVAFDEAVAAGDRTRALELYGGEFLKGFHLSECIDFEQWVHSERKRLHDAAVEAAWGLADEQRVGGNGIEAVHWARRAVALAPDDESSVRRLMALLAAAGDRTGALREFEALKRQMRELELDVSEETRKLAEQVRTSESGSRTTARVEATEAPVAPTLRPAPAVSGQELPQESGRQPAQPIVPERRRTALWVAAAAGAFVIIASAAAWMARSGEPPLYDEKRVLVAEFTNETGDPELAALGRATADWLAQGLSQTGLVEVVPAITAMRSAQALDVALEAPPVVISRALAEETGAGILVSGAYYKEGARLIFHSRITDARTGQVLRGVEPVSGAVAEPMAAVDQMRRRVVGALASILDARLSSWGSVASQPPSFEAYQLYAEGLDEFFRNDDEGYQNAAVRFREAAALDPAFTAPLIWAIFAHMNIEQLAAADSLIRSVERSRPDLAAWDRAVLSYQQARIAGRDVAAYNAARRVAELAPQSEWRFLLASSAITVNRPREAMAILKGVDPDRGWIRTWPPYWTALGTAEHFAGDFRTELSTLQRGLARHSHPRLVLFQFRALGALGRVDHALALLDSLAAAGAPPGVLANGYVMLARELRVHRDSTSAVKVALRGLDQIKAPTGAGGGGLRFTRSLLMIEAGLWEDAYAAMGPTPPAAFGGSNVGVRAIAAARLGKRDEALAAADMLARMEPDTTIQGAPGGLMKLWAAGIYAHLGERDRAMELLRAARSEGVSVTGMGIHGNVGLAPLQGYRPFEALVRPAG
jgi:DNA-binding SARP family transcriptional activator/tetratricopeptide (TPR) repeat protein/TolB-like protein